MPPIPPKANSQLIAETLDLCSMVSENVAQAERTVGGFGKPLRAAG